MVLPGELPLVCRSTGGSKVREGRCPDILQKYREDFVHRGMFTEHVRLVLRRYLKDGTNVKTVPTLEEQDALNPSGWVNYECSSGR